MTMINGLLLGGFMFFSGLMVLIFQWKHILNILLSFEILMLSIIISFLFTWGLYSSDYMLSMIIIVFSVSEASLGLSLLVSLIRCYGNDYVKSLSMYKL
uniref:NADH-ubiquinone oxidoreductase chain 4L n=1 Tax=Vampyroteuthis infernalis TaxID=55288 RepID=A7BG41_9MOLL|nr:NADH dehydrogenase subunit 4L [Vampyroteuthis infernalis]BAF73644.1 NADH dehydrogenase subunit 4L [Vampyroteuthis infernalis]